MPRLVFFRALIQIFRQASWPFQVSPRGFPVYAQSHDTDVHMCQVIFMTKLYVVSTDLYLLLSFQGNNSTAAAWLGVFTSLYRWWGE